MRPLCWLSFTALVALAAPGGAATHVDPRAWCGTHPSRLTETLAAHRDFERRLARVSGDRTPLTKLAVPADQVGEVAVLLNDGSLIHEPNPIDLAESGLSFVYKKNGLQATAGSNAIGSAIGSKLDLTDDSSVLVPFPRGFRFRFYNKSYTAMFVNSDGNLTFTAGDSQSSERSVARFLNGPPRVSPFFADLDPENLADDAGIFVLTSKTKVVITWVAVPEFGKTNQNTFQVTLFKNGNVTFAYGGLDGKEAVVGVAPGDGGKLQLLDYTADLPTANTTGALAERFGTDRDLDEVAIANAFFQQFADDYDHLIVWLDFSLRLGGGAFAYEFSPKNEVRGIGLPVYDDTASFGSRGRLRSFVEMGTLSRYPVNPDETFLGTNSTMDVLGQEAGHRWLAFLTFRGPGGARSTDLLGRDLAHWSFTFDSDASDEEGNDIRDNGDGSYTTVAATERFSLLDQYVMGLVSPAEVPSMFYVADSGISPGAPPAVGAAISGRRVDVDLADIIAAEGPRVPASAAAPKAFNMAFIVVSRDGTFPSEASIHQVDTFRSRWEEYFNAATDGHGSVDTTLRPR